MHNVFLLIKVYFNSFIGGIAKSKKIGKYLNALLLVGLVGLLMIAFFTYSAYTLTKEFVSLDNVNYSYAGYAIFSTCSNIILMTLLFIALRSTAPTRSSDANLLLSMPIKKSEMIIAKSLVSYLIDLMALISFILPNFIIYAILVKTASKWLIFRGLLILLVMPLFINGVSTIIGNLINKFTKKMKLVSLIQFILLLILMALFLVFNFTINDILTKNLNIGLSEVLDKVWIIRIFYKFIINNQFLYFLLIGLVALGLYSVGVIIRKNEFGKEVVYLKSETKTLKYAKNSAFFDILKKEANRFFTSPLYMLNSSFGAILVVGASIYVLVKGRGVIDSIVMQILKLDANNSPYVVLLLASAFLSTVCTTYCTISLEGKSFWILKSLPISEKTIFYGKISFNFILSSITGLIATIFICLVFGFQYLLIYLPFIILLALLISSLGLYLNLVFPKMEWESETVPIKQSISLLVVMAVSLFIPIIFLAFYLLIKALINQTLIIMIFDLILLILNFIIYKLLNNKGIKLFKSIN